MMEAAVSILGLETKLAARITFTSDEQFQVNCLTAKEIGLWAASRLGFDGGRSRAYAHDLVEATLEPGGLNIIKKLQADFLARGILVSERRIAAIMENKRKAAEQKVRQRLWLQDANHAVEWERRKCRRVGVGPLSLPYVLKLWLERHEKHMHA